MSGKGDAIFLVLAFRSRRSIAVLILSGSPSFWGFHRNNIGTVFVLFVIIHRSFLILHPTMVLVAQGNATDTTDRFYQDQSKVWYD